MPGIGRGLGGGLMEYPWWFGTDASYSLQALVATGNAELAKQTLRLLRDQSLKANGNGRIVHEVTTNGGVVNPGNTQETAQFIMAVGKVFDWTGDLAFAREMYPSMKLGLRWLLTDMDQNHESVPGRLWDHGGVGPQRGADRCGGVHPAGAGGHGAHRPHASGAGHRRRLRATGIGTEGAHQRRLLGRRRGLIRRLLRDRARRQ